MAKERQAELKGTKKLAQRAERATVQARNSEGKCGHTLQQCSSKQDLTRIVMKPTFESPVGAISSIKAARRGKTSEYATGDRGASAPGSQEAANKERQQYPSNLLQPRDFISQHVKRGWCAKQSGAERRVNLRAEPQSRSQASDSPSLCGLIPTRTAN